LVLQIIALKYVEMPLRNLISNGLKLTSICSNFYSTNCWSCQRVFNEKEAKKLVCPCSKEIIQAPNKNLNYFELFNLDASFNINQKDLTKSFRDLMRILHPDKFTNKSNVNLSINNNINNMFYLFIF
jgi:hypothetical protein